MGALALTHASNAAAKDEVLDIEWKPNTGLPIDDLSAIGTFSWKNKLVQGFVPPPSAPSLKKKDKNAIEQFVTVEPLASVFKEARPKRTRITSKDWYMIIALAGIVL